MTKRPNLSLTVGFAPVTFLDAPPIVASSVASAI